MEIRSLHFVIAMVAGWLQREQGGVIAYLKEENKVLREQLGETQIGVPGHVLQIVPVHADCKFRDLAAPKRRFPNDSPRLLLIPRRTGSWTVSRCLQSANSCVGLKIGFFLNQPNEISR